MYEPLLIPLAAIVSGICLSQFLPFSLKESLTVSALLTLIALVAYYRCVRWYSRFTMFLALAAAGIALDVAHRPGPPPTIEADSQEVMILSGCVVDPPVFTADREHFVVELSPHARARVALALRPDDQPPKLDYGQMVEFDGKIRRPRNFGNPGAFDYVRYLARQDVYWTASVRAGTPIKVLDGRCGSRAVSVIFGLRQRALERMERLYAGNDYAIGMLEAILIGESTKLEKVWTDHFRRTGTYHALVISGLHVTVLAGVLLFLLRMCMLNEIPALLIAAVAAWLYAGVSGWSAPVIRAAGGFTLFLAGRYFFRRGRLLNLLASIGIAYLIYDPGQLFDASFQLSFFSVAAIGAFAVPLLELTSGAYRDVTANLRDTARDFRATPKAAALRVELRLLAETFAIWTKIPVKFPLAALGLMVRLVLWIYEMAVISCVVQVALALPMALYFHRISVTGVSANLLIVPLLSIVVPVGFAAIFTGWSVFAWAALLLLNWSEAVANWHVRWEPAMRVPDPPVWLGVALTSALVLAGIALRARSRWRWPAIAAALGLFATMFASPFAPQIERGRLELTVIDVGQGDSLFVAMPDGRTMIVDAGGIPAFGRKTKPKMDIGEDVVSSYLWTRHIRRVDVIAITHAHEDHIGGLVALLDNFHPAELWTGATPEEAHWTAIEQHARDRGIRVVHRHAGEHIGNIDILAPFADYEAGLTAKNNDSLAMRLTFGEHSFLLMGDMEKQIEYRLVADNAVPRTTVLKVAHHGSKTSSTEEFLNASQPAVALISAGFENMFRHPHPDVIERLAEHHVAVMRTDADGLVTVRTDGHRLEILRPGHDASRISSDPTLPAW